MQSDAMRCREIALHAGQCLRLILASRSESTCELLALFYVALALHAFALAQDAIEGGDEAIVGVNTVDLDCQSPG